jgi:Holliday junction DNA helicase RuvA
MAENSRMIGFLRGVLARKEPPFLLVDVNGVGYELEVPMSTLFRLPEIGAEVQLRTQMVIRDDQQTLFGFGTEEERHLFRNLVKVNGVGAKLALTILSGISVEGFIRCVQTEDKVTLTKLPGIGRKTAERLILDMRDRIEKFSGHGAPAKGFGGIPDDGASPRAEAFNALVTLGYKPAETRRMLEKVATENQTTEEILRSVLRAATS